MSLVTKSAPDFTSHALLSNGEITHKFNFYQFKENKYAIVFFWPMDFTFVCPSELISLNKSYQDLKKRNTEIVGISIDSEFVHYAWRSTPINEGGIGLLQYPMVADVNHKIIKLYGVEHPDLGVALRGTFIIDKNNIVRSQMINDLPIGRNISEFIRIIDALQFIEDTGLVCPAQWEKNKPGMVPSKKGVSSYLSNNFNLL